MAFTMNNVVGTANTVANTETTTIATPAVAYYPTGSFQGVAIGGCVNVTNNTSTTMVLRVRNGSSTAGTLIGSAQTVTTVSVATLNLPFYVVDTTNPPATQYNLTLTPTSGTGTAVTNSASIYTDIVNL